MGGRTKKAAVRAASILAAAAIAALIVTPAADAGTREPLALAYAALQGRVEEPASDRPDAQALRGPRPSREDRGVPGAGEATISSAYYGSEQMDAVRAILDRLDHGPEMAQLSVYVATPAEIAETCGEAVIACYAPSRMEMIVSGVDQPVDGVPWAFAIAHEYGHHIAETQRGDLYPAIEAGTIRWATYERVCQFTRSHRLFPGNQGAHYWQDPEEAFAESYAHLSDLQDSVPWQYTPLLQPTETSLAKIQQDLEHPWGGPVTETLAGSVGAAARAAAPSGVSGPDGTAVAGGRAVAGEPGFARLLRTPLDGNVTVSVQAPAGADLSVSLRDPQDDRVLSSATTGEAGSAEVAFSNCGHDSLTLVIRSLGGPATFQASVVKP